MSARRTVVVGLAMIVGLSAIPSRTQAASASAWIVLGKAAYGPIFYHPTALGIGSGGAVYVMDSGNFRVVAVAAAGRVVTRFGERGSGRGQFGTTQLFMPGREMKVVTGPDSLALDRQGNVYVADSVNSRIEKFSSSGRFLDQWPIQEVGATVTHLAVTVGPSGNVLVAAAARVQCTESCASFYVMERRSPSGDLQARWQSAHPPAGPQSDPDHIDHITLAVDRRGNVYVATYGVVECYKSCPNFSYVEKRSFSGRLLTRWGNLGYSLSQPAVSAIAVGGRGNLLLAENDARQIEKRSPMGKRLGVWSRPFGFVPPFYASPAGIATDAQGRVYASDTGSGSIVTLSSAGKLLKTWGVAGSTPGRFRNPGATALSGGVVTALDVGNERVQHLALSAGVRAPWPVKSAGFTLAGDGQGNAYIPQASGPSVFISKYTSSGRLLASLAKGMHIASMPAALALDPHGNIFIFAQFDYGASDYRRNGPYVLELSPSGGQLSLWKAPMPLARGGMAVDGQGIVYLTDYYGSRVFKLTSSGGLLATWRGYGKAPEEQFQNPTGIAVDGNGDMFIADTGNDRIQELSPTGASLTQWGSSGSAPGQFHQPTWLSLSPRGDLVVTDSGNQRLQATVIR